MVFHNVMRSPVQHEHQNTASSLICAERDGAAACVSSDKLSNRDVEESEPIILAFSRAREACRLCLTDGANPTSKSSREDWAGGARDRPTYGFEPLGVAESSLLS